jgi:double-strand break repair protein AddB
MFDPAPGPRVFGLPIGVDFASALVDGVTQRMHGTAPEALARVVIYVNTSRMQRRIRQLFEAQGARLLPHIRLITDLAHDPMHDLPMPMDGLERRLDLARLVRKLIESDETLAATDAAYDLADSLAALFEEMQSERVSAEAIAGLDVGKHSAHWERSQKFIGLVHRYLGPDSSLDTEGRQRAVVEALAHEWRTSPPDHPVLVAGSTGSRGTTRAFMRAVAKLPQGAVLLPGFDTAMPPALWATLAGDPDGPPPSEDHPQFRYAKLMQELDLGPGEVVGFTETAPISPARGALVSLALRPAPVTDAWLEEGPALEGIAQATEGLTLLEAPTPRAEALSIALRLRQAAEDGTRAALITTDQTLTRQVSAALQAWRIDPNDSAGARLDLSPPGRLLRQTAALIGADIGPAALLALLKHPLIYGPNRSAHLSRTRDLEMKVLRGGPPALRRDHCEKWAQEREAEDPGALDWHEWIWSCLEALTALSHDDLTPLTRDHVAQTERLTQGPDPQDAAHLWLKSAGEKAQEVMSSLLGAAPSAGRYSPAEYRDLILALLSREETRDPFFSHPDIMIWGTLEARVQGADLVILAGLNDGTWPAMPEPDPWLNRDMRRAAGLRLPEARIGLSAHDFQQGIAAREVWLTRATRDSEAETVPSRWLNRITNLLTGLSDEGKAAHAAMQKRGKCWLERAQSYDTPRLGLPKAPRPAPQPPVEARPKRLSVTHIETLIRDPYAVYARHILDLRPLKPLLPEADAALRGVIIHKVLHQFIEQHKTGLPDNPESALLTLAEEVFASHIAWPATRSFWLSKLARAVPWFIQTERARRAIATPIGFEAEGFRTSAKLDFTLRGFADRVDRDATGALVLYDYKTGVLPTEKVQKNFNKQLPLLAAIGAANGFEKFPSNAVRQASYIGLGSTPGEASVEANPDELAKIWAELEELIAQYQNPDQGYAARRAVHEDRWDQDYDQLARYGEWDLTQAAHQIRVQP